MVNIYQQGGQMSDEQKAFTAYLINILQPTSQKDFEDKVAKLSENDLKQYYKQFKAMENGTITMAALGAKINYLQTLRGECPEGYEVEKFMAGGCVKCKKKAQGGVTEVFKDKCGGKAKKRITKKQNGGKAYNEAEHARLIKDYQAGKIKQNSPQHNRLAELNRTSGHHDDGWEPKEAPKSKPKTPTKAVPKRLQKKPQKKG